MAQLLIVYHSRTGGSRQMAEAAFAAAREEVTSTLKSAADAKPDDLMAADGYIFCAPENLAAISGVMKDFFDRCYYPVLGRIEEEPTRRWSVQVQTAKTQRVKQHALQRAGACEKCKSRSSSAQKRRHPKKFLRQRRSRRTN